MSLINKGIRLTLQGFQSNKTYMRGCNTNVQAQYYLNIQPIYSSNLRFYTTRKETAIAKKFSGNDYLESDNGLRDKDSFTEKIKEKIAFYKQGLKQIFTNRKLAKEINSSERVLTRKEFQLVRKAKEDFNLLLPFGLLLVLLPESIPFIVIFAPQFIPSTCVTPEQKQNRRIKLQEKRDAITITALKSATSNGQLLNHKDFDSLDKTLALIPEFKDSFAIDLLDKKPLSKYCEFMGLASWGTNNMLKNRMLEHFKYLRQDDQLLANNEKVGDKLIPAIDLLNEAELIDANEERGMKAVNQNELVLRNNLKDWTRLSLYNDPQPPEILLVVSRVFYNNLNHK